MSEPSVDRDPFEVVAESFLARFRAGERPSIDEYAARHPELADQIRELLPALVMVEQDLSIDVDASAALRRDAIESPSRTAGRLPHPPRDRPGRDGGRLRGRAGQPGPPGGAEGPAPPDRA